MIDYNYAVINQFLLVDNIVISDSPDSQVALSLLIPEANQIILITEETGPAYIGGEYINGKFRTPKPYDSWIWNENNYMWESSIPYPQDDKVYTWNEELLSWIELIPTPDQLESIEQI